MTIAGVERDKRTPSNPGRVDLKVSDFDRILEDQGVRVKVTPSILCPNRQGLHSTNHALNCPTCNLSEAIELPAQSYEEYALIQSVNFKLDWTQSGLYSVKDAVMTIKGGRRLWYYDKVEILDSTSIFNQVVERTGTTDQLRYAAQNAATTTPFFLADKDGTEYILRTDYNVSGKTLTWVTTGPEEKSLYSIQYPILPVFRVLELLHENRYYYESSGNEKKIPVHLPQQCVLRWDYFRKDGGANEAYPVP